MFPASSFQIVETPVAWALLAATENGLANVQFGDSPEALQRAWLIRAPLSAPVESGGVGVDCLALAAAALTRFKAVPLQMDLRGTPFQREVWQQLQEIPWGEVVTYTELAARLERPTAVRAVASACGANHLAWFIPCHRVVRKNGDLGGYRWGLGIKEKLLQYERSSS